MGTILGCSSYFSLTFPLKQKKLVCSIVASLLSCLHQLRTENVRLEEHVGSLLQRRDHLLAVNARLAIPLTTGTFIYMSYFQATSKQFSV